MKFPDLRIQSTVSKASAFCAISIVFAYLCVWNKAKTFWDCCDNTVNDTVNILYGVAVIDLISETFALSGESYENCHWKKIFVDST